MKTCRKKHKRKLISIYFFLFSEVGWFQYKLSFQTILLALGLRCSSIHTLSLCPKGRVLYFWGSLNWHSSLVNYLANVKSKKLSHPTNNCFVDCFFCFLFLTNFHCFSLTIFLLLLFFCNFSYLAIFLTNFWWYFW